MKNGDVGDLLSTTSSPSTIPSLHSRTSDPSSLWKGLSIFITLDVIIWIAVRRYAFRKTKKDRFQQEFSSWSRMAYEQQTSKTHSSTYQGNSSHKYLNYAFKHESNRVIDRHLDILEIPKVVGVIPKEAEIKEAYRKICLKTHPDVLGTDHPEKHQAEKRFIDATTSYNFLLNFVRK